MVDSDDSALLSKAQAGDTVAFEALVEANQERVYGLALRMTRSAADAAEITQEVFLSAYQNLKDFRGDAAFSSWVHRIAANRAIMRIRHNNVVRAVEEPLDGPSFTPRGGLADVVADWAPTGEDSVLDEELRRAIETATDSLPEDHRRVFILKDIEELSYEDIAEVTGDSVPAIKSRLHRARLALRAAIDHFYEDREV